MRLVLLVGEASRCLRSGVTRPQLLVDGARLVVHDISGVPGALALDQHDQALFVGDGIVAHSLRHDEHVALVEHHGAIVHFHP